MKFEVTKQWLKLPYGSVTVTIPSLTNVYFSTNGGDSVGIPFIGEKNKPFYADGDLFVRIDGAYEKDSVTIEIENFI